MFWWDDGGAEWDGGRDGLTQQNQKTLWWCLSV
jgi:hypothetical protein